MCSVFRGVIQQEEECHLTLRSLWWLIGTLVAYRHCDTLWKAVDGFEELLTLTDFINLSNKLFST